MIDIFNQIYWEGMYLDLWSLDHFLSGIMLAFIPLLFPKISPRKSLVISIAVLILWELGETFFAIEEPLRNRTLDVIIGLAGFALGYFILHSLSKSKKTSTTLFIAMGIITIFFSSFAWLAYLSYS